MDKDEKLILNQLLSSQRRANYIAACKELAYLDVLDDEAYAKSLVAIVEQEGFKCPLLDLDQN